MECREFCPKIHHSKWSNSYMDKYVGSFSSIQYHEIDKRISGEIGVEFLYSRETDKIEAIYTEGMSLCVEKCPIGWYSAENDNEWECRKCNYAKCFDCILSPDHCTACQLNKYRNATLILNTYVHTCSSECDTNATGLEYNQYSNTCDACEFFC